MSTSDQLISETLKRLGNSTGKITVALSNELVQLLSDQLYQSPIKAVEELVVNAYDAEASECKIYVPEPSNTVNKFVVVFDDGIGMDKEGLADLWQIGRSNKRSEEIQRRAKRKQIGKFGIGKLATYAISNKITYISKLDGKILAVSLDFRDFTASTTGAGKPIELDVTEISNLNQILNETLFVTVCNLVGIDFKALDIDAFGSWTLVLLEDLKPKIKKLTHQRLKWVLSTAMPLKSDFALYLNGQKVISSKEEFKVVVSFNITDLPRKRIESLQHNTKQEWRVANQSFICNDFQQGISGHISITERSLRGGKSTDLHRSNGFFIKVRERLINQEDESFGLTLSSMETFSRFRADIQVDDLDSVITAPREGVEESLLKTRFQYLLLEIYNEARGRYENYLRENEKKDQRRKENDRNFVSSRLVEQPVADLLSMHSSSAGSEADSSWFYIELNETADLGELVKSLYTSPRHKYRYQYTNNGVSQRLVKFNPLTSTFWINEDHDLVKAHSDDGRARILLEDIATAEALLEVYLRENDVPSYVIGEVLERRDALLRSLAQDHPFSLKTISASLRDAAANDHELEAMLVTATRALGFVSKHIAGPGEPDGLARLMTYPEGEKKITLEAKASENIPQLNALDFAGLREHMRRYKANGCLLVAPSYPGVSKGSDSSVSIRAKELGISCWTVEQLAQVVETAETRHITAIKILDLVTKHFSPEDVTEAIKELLEEPNWDMTFLYKAIINALKQLENRLPDAPRSVDQIAAIITLQPGFESVEVKDIEAAISAVAATSQGGIVLRADKIVINASFDEIERRIKGLTQESGKPRRASGFRQDDN